MKKIFLNYIHQTSNSLIKNLKLYSFLFLLLAGCGYGYRQYDDAINRIRQDGIIVGDSSIRDVKSSNSSEGGFDGPGSTPNGEEKNPSGINPEDLPEGTRP